MKSIIENHNQDPIKHISAKCNSDDYKIEVEFNALEWAKNADEYALSGLISCGFDSDYASDAVALYMEDHDKNVSNMFKYIELLNNAGEDCGFSCSVNESDLMLFIKNERPDILLTDSFSVDDGSALDSYDFNSVDIDIESIRSNIQDSNNSSNGIDR